MWRVGASPTTGTKLCPSGGIGRRSSFKNCGRKALSVRIRGRAPHMPAWRSSRRAVLRGLCPCDGWVRVPPLAPRSERRAFGHRWPMHCGIGAKFGTWARVQRGSHPLSERVEAASVRDGRRPVRAACLRGRRLGQGEKGSHPSFETSLCRTAQARGLDCGSGWLGSIPRFGSILGM